MAQYDEHTKKFIKDVAGKEPKKPNIPLPEKTIAGHGLSRAALGTAISLITKDPKPAMRGATALAASKTWEPDKISGPKPETPSIKTAAPSETNILTIYRLMNLKYEQDWWDWEPETIYQALGEDFKVLPDDRLRDMLGALQVTINTNAPFEHWHIFENVGHAFNQNPVSFAIVQPLELDEASWAVRVLKRIRPKEEFEDDVCAYIAACAKNSGVVYLPPELFPGKCQIFLDDMINDLELKEEVKRKWPDTLSGNSALAIQTLRLDEIREYVRDDRIA